MDCRALLPNQLPHTSKLIRDYVTNFSNLESFFSHPPDLASVFAEARKLDFPADRRRQVAAILREQNVALGSGPETEKNLQRLENGTVIPLEVKEGDRVLFGKYSGTEIKVDDNEYLILREDEILGILATSGKAAGKK